MRLRRIGIVVALVLGAGVARADNLALFHIAIEDVAAHNRAAIGYLRDKNLDLAAVEIERMKESWGAFAEHFGHDRPDKLRHSKLYVTMLVDVPTRLVTATIMINFGKPEIAKSALESIRQEFSDVRRDGGVEILADCVLDAHAALAGAADSAIDLAAKAAAYGATVRRCDAMAPPPVHDNADFRRLVGGIAASLASLPGAGAAHDDAALRRVIDELRSFDTVMVLRYG
jgi:hypothetical protein